jgi:hypothetical protein
MKGDYFGTRCENTFCFNISSTDSKVCSSRGNCKIYNNCSCIDGFVGENCEKIKKNEIVKENEVFPTWVWYIVGGVSFCSVGLVLFCFLIFGIFLLLSCFILLSLLKKLKYKNYKIMEMIELEDLPAKDNNENDFKIDLKKKKNQIKFLDGFFKLKKNFKK